MCKGPDPEGMRHTEELEEGQNGQSVGSYRDESEEVGRVLLRTKVEGGTYIMFSKVPSNREATPLRSKFC